MSINDQSKELNEIDLSSYQLNQEPKKDLTCVTRFEETAHP